MANDEVVIIPRRAKNEPDWRITAPRLKVALKYGIGPSPWKYPNWSVEFDRYAIGRGPQSGLPSLVDLSVTTLMNSRVVSSDLRRATAWLAADENQRDLSRLRAQLVGCDGLASAPPEAVTHLGEIIDRMRGAVQEESLAEDGRRPMY